MTGNIRELFSLLALMICYLICPQSLVAQQSKLKIKGIKVSKLNINFDANGNVMKYLNMEDNNAAPRDLKSEQTFSLIDNYSNLNFRWKNPLKFTFTWKDSTYADEQQAALKDFLKLLTPFFNIPDAGASGNSSKLLDSAIFTVAALPNPIQKPSGGFKDYDLTLLYIQLILGQNKLTAQERMDINKFTPKLKLLEESDKDYQSDARKAFLELFNETDPFNVTKKSKDGVADIAEDNVKAWITSLDNNVKLRGQVATSLADIKIGDELFNSLFQSSILKYLEKSKSLNTTNLSVVNKLKPLIEKLKKSVTGDNVPFAFGNVQDLVRVRTIDLEEGKVLQTDLVITQFKIGEDGLSVEKESDNHKMKFTFRGYDPVAFSVSTGIFYGSTNLRGFGTSNSGGEMVVTEDTLRKNTAVGIPPANYILST